MGRVPKPTADAVTFESEKHVAIDELNLDMGNNRVIHLTIKDKQELEERLWLEGKLSQLKNDIKARGLQEPLVLFPQSFTVAEGNCRLVCLKRLQREAAIEQEKSEPFVSDLRLKDFLDLKVPCKRIMEGTPIVDIDAYLTEIHVGRKRKWPEYNQAKLLFKLKYDDDLTLEEIARISRSSRPTISRKIEAYKYTSMYREKFSDDAEFVKWFYYFWEFTHRSLDEFRGDSTKVTKFMKWIHSGKFSNSKEVRVLPKVLDNQAAFRRFEEADMAGARRIIIKADPTITSPLYRKVSSLANILEAFPPREFRLLLNDSSRRDLLRNLITNATKLLKEAISNGEDKK